MVETLIHEVVNVVIKETEKFNTSRKFYTRTIEIEYLDHLNKKQTFTLMLFANEENNLKI
jgi:hypothetical protein